MLNELAWLLATCPDDKYRDAKRSVELATKACELTGWRQWNNLDTLAAAYAETGNFTEAVKWQEKALELVPGQRKPEIAHRLELYKSGTPYRNIPAYRPAGERPGGSAGKLPNAVRLAWFPRLSPDNKWLVTSHGSWEEKEPGEVRVWNFETGEIKFIIPSERGVRTAGWSPSGKLFIPAITRAIFVLRCGNRPADRRNEVAVGGSAAIPPGRNTAGHGAFGRLGSYGGFGLEERIARLARSP